MERRMGRKERDRLTILRPWAERRLTQGAASGPVALADCGFSAFSSINRTSSGGFRLIQPLHAEVPAKRQRRRPNAGPKPP